MLDSEKKFSCWNCSNNIIAFNNESVIKCPNCNKYNKVPSSVNKDNTKVFKSFRFKNSFSSSEENTFNNLKKIISCPFCDTENIFRRSADKLLCYNCGKNILFNKDIKINNYTNTQINNIKSIVGWKIVPSINTLNSLKSLNSVNSINPIQNITPLQPTISPSKNNDNTEYLLKKILKTIKKNENNSTTIPLSPQQQFYPMSNFMPFSFLDYIRSTRKYENNEKRNYSCASPEIKYIPIKTEVNEKKNDSGYKIVIRKKKTGISNIRNKIFEKVFYSK